MLYVNIACTLKKECIFCYCCNNYFTNIMQLRIPCKIEKGIDPLTSRRCLWVLVYPLYRYTRRHFETILLMHIAVQSHVLNLGIIEPKSSFIEFTSSPSLFLWGLCFILSIALTSPLPLQFAHYSPQILGYCLYMDPQ